VNAPGQIPQLGQGFLGVLVSRADQDPGPVAVVGASGRRGQVFLDLAQLTSTAAAMRGGGPLGNSSALTEKSSTASTPSSSMG
jgi:hypothetical protein